MGQSLALNARNRYAAVKRHHPDDIERINAARRDLAEAKIAGYIERVVNEAPPLSETQRERLAALLRGGPVAS